MRKDIQFRLSSFCHVDFVNFISLPIDVGRKLNFGPKKMSPRKEREDRKAHEIRYLEIMTLNRWKLKRRRKRKFFAWEKGSYQRDVRLIADRQDMNKANCADILYISDSRQAEQQQIFSILSFRLVYSIWQIVFARQMNWTKERRTNILLIPVRK